MYVSKWPDAFPHNPAWRPIQFYYDPVHQSFNDTYFGYNFIVIQSSQGQCITSGFYPPNTQYWVANGFSVTNNNEVQLYHVHFPGWSACLRTNAETGHTYYQVHLSFSLGVDCSYIIRTSVPVVRLLNCT